MPISIKGRSRGFTLVEMSIVLVIIGLIIGGILKGQEVIASARQKAVINQVNAVRSAAGTYFDRYRALPGDDPKGSSVDNNVANGDGNGYVGVNNVVTAATIGSTAGNTGENYQFFNGLVAANLLNGAQVTAAAQATTFGNASALPASPITGAGVTVLYGLHPGSAAGAPTSRSTHWLRLHKNAANPASSVSARTLANIDTQIDDGLAGAGGVRGNGGTCDGGTNYVVTDDITCIPLFEISQ